jgi:hypothetical protein
MSNEKTLQPDTKSQPASQISKILGPIKLLPGESEAVYRAGLIGAISELGAATHLQIYLAEKIFQCLWWMRRYEVQKQAAIVNAMVDLLTRHDIDKKLRTAITHNLQVQLWSDPQMLKIIEALGHTPESLAAKATSNTREEIQKIDFLIALRVKALGQLQQS